MKFTTYILSLLILPLSVLLAKPLQDSDAFKFSHKYHKEMGIEDCSTCHMSVTESTSGTDDLLPGAETCEMCHGDAVTPATDLPRITEYQQIFSHSLHAVENEIECTTCHQGVMESESYESRHLPEMADCYSCHQPDVQQVPEDCGMCHGPEESLTPASHTTSWKNYHGILANTGRQECQTCHVSERFCQDCHLGANVTQQTHPVNWEYAHGLEARQQSADCATCHENKQFCAECHQANLVMPVKHSLPAWSNNTTGGMHAREAATDVDYCVTCHRDPGSESTCLECHSN